MRSLIMFGGSRHHTIAYTRLHELRQGTLHLEHIATEVGGTDTITCTGRAYTPPRCGGYAQEMTSTCRADPLADLLAYVTVIGEL